MNPIHRALTARISALLISAEEAGAVPHSATAGQLREQILIEFFRALIPKSLSVTSGVICDARGTVSRQTDFIVKNDNLLPSMMMSDTVALIPIETVYLTAEVKSKLKTDHLAKFSSDRVAFNRMQPAIWPVPEESSEFKIPSVVIAYDSDVAIETLRRWMLSENDVVSVCVIGKHTLSKVAGGIELYKSSSARPHYETLRFAEQIFTHLNNTLNAPRENLLWSAYLRGPDELTAPSPENFLIPTP